MLNFQNEFHRYLAGWPLTVAAQGWEKQGEPLNRREGRRCRKTSRGQTHQEPQAISVLPVATWRKASPSQILTWSNVC